jgi:allantoin racemase
VLAIPVIPPGSTAKHICSLLGPKFSIITVGDGPARRPEIHERDGLIKLVSIHPTGFSVPEVRAKPKETYEAMIREGKKSVEYYGAASVTFGCMSMGFLMIDEKLREEIGVPVVNPVKVAVRTAEIFIDLGLTHSKRVYPVPPSL